MRFGRPTRSLTAAIAAASLLALAACSSTPSPKAVAQDYVESIEGLSTEQRQCMLERLDNYSEDQLEAIGEANLTVDFDDQSAAETATTPEFQAFVDDLAECVGSG